MQTTWVGSLRRKKSTSQSPRRTRKGQTQRRSERKWRLFLSNAQARLMSPWTLLLSSLLSNSLSKPYEPHFQNIPRIQPLLTTSEALPGTPAPTPPSPPHSSHRALRLFGGRQGLPVLPHLTSNSWTLASRCSSLPSSWDYRCATRPTQRSFKTNTP
jgi:hypothetical protein